MEKTPACLSCLAINAIEQRDTQKYAQMALKSKFTT